MTKVAAAKVPKKAPATKTTKEAAATVDCKNFFPSVGMTLTVRCE